MSKIKLLIVDDHPLILEGLKKLLSDEDSIDVTHLCSSAIESIQVMKEEQPDIALLDINLPDINGIELCVKIKKEFPEVKTIALTTYSQRSYVNKMMQAGASGYLLKNATKSEIIEAIREVYDGGMYFKVKEEDESAFGDNSPSLTPRESEVLGLIANGLTNSQIAEKLFVSVLTVNSHRKNLLNKFQVNNTAMLIKQAVVAGLV